MGMLLSLIVHLTLERMPNLSVTNITIKTRSSSENHTMALFDPKTIKTKDASKGENLSEAPEDGRFDILPFSTN